MQCYFRLQFQKSSAAGPKVVLGLLYFIFPTGEHLPSYFHCTWFFGLFFAHDDM